MAVIMYIDTMVLGDTRVERLARVFGWTRRETLGALLDVWAVCYYRKVNVLAVEDIDIAAGQPGFADALVHVAQLADVCTDGLYMRGSFRVPVAGETDTEKPESSNARARVRAHVRTRTRARKRTPVPTAAHLSLSDQGVVDHVDHSQQLGSEDGGVGEGEKPKRRVTRSEILPVTDAFMACFAQVYGKKPTWGAREIAQIKRLVSQHDTAEVVRRVHVLFDSPPRWLNPPFTLATVVRHFDALVQPEQVVKRSTKHGRHEPDPDADHSVPPWETEAYKK